jgi:SAM-dependent methyltransferase
MSVITLETNYPGALDSPDHLCPHGCILDNFASIGLMSEISEYFDDKQIVMIDLGCAGGQFVADFIGQGDIGIGLEGSSNALQGSGKSNWQKYHNKNLFLCDISEDYQLFLNGEPLKADFIHSEEVFEHISEDKIDNLLKNIKKHLKSDGICAFGISLTPDIQERDGKIYELHQSVFPATWWREKIESNGFEILDGGRNDENHFGYIFNNTVRWDGHTSVFICCKLK